MGARTNKTPKQSRKIASFSATYPAVLAGPKAERIQGYDFGALKTFKDSDDRDCIKGLSFTLTKNMRIEVSALKRHFNARLYRYPEVKDLYLKIMEASMDFWDTYAPLLTGFYTKLLSKVCEGATCSKVSNMCVGR